MKCLKCGHSLKSWEVLCPSCTVDTSTLTPWISDRLHGSTFCPECGTTLKKSSKVCPTCVLETHWENPDWSLGKVGSVHNCTRSRVHQIIDQYEDHAKAVIHRYSKSNPELVEKFSSKYPDLVGPGYKENYQVPLNLTVLNFGPGEGI